MVKVKITASNEYNYLTGLIKTLKNVGIVYGIPALLAFLTNAEAWLPEKYVPITAVIVAGISYYVKNYVSNK